MEAPPSQPYYPQKKKSNVGLILIIIALVVGICCIVPLVGLGIFGYKMFGVAKGFLGCGISAQENRDAMILYAKDHDGKLPAAENWQEDVKPYLAKASVTTSGQDRQTLGVPGPNDGFCDKTNVTVLTFNSDLAGKKLDDLKDGDNLIVLYEAFGTGRNKFAKYVEPDAKTGPSFAKGVPRGWVLQPLKGAGYLLGLNGQRTPINFNKPGKNGVSIDVESKTSSDN